MNNETDFGVGIISGIVVGFFVGFLVANLLSKSKSVIEECEKSLPRDKHCKVIGVIDNERKN